MIRSFLVCGLALSGVLAAQEPPTWAGRLSYVSGPVSFEPAGVDNWVEATVNRPLTIGDQLYADVGARAEVNVPGTAFRLGDRAAFQFLNLDDHAVQVKLSEGTLDVRVRRPDANLEIDTPNVAFVPGGPGEYRLDVNLNDGRTYVDVRDGGGQLTTGAGSITVSMGQQAEVMGQGASAQYKINGLPGYDGFDHWAIERNRTEDRYAQARYVSPEMVGYQDLDEYGTWREVPDYGEVWVPNGVAAGWAPYSDGNWAWIEPWGWTWVDAEPWGFAPFHYGRWAYLSGYWGWCPGPAADVPIYAPALVAWVGFGGVSVGFGAGPAVGWFPLGPRDVYIPAFTASATYITRINVTNTRLVNATYVTRVYRGYERSGSIPIDTYMNRTVPGAILAAPENALTDARRVQQVARRVQPNQLAAIHAVNAAPRVVPQVASVLGRQPAARVPRPAAAVLSHPVVARTTPPALPGSFAARRAELARQPGRPLSMTEMHQLAHASPATGSAPVHVMQPGHAMPAEAAHAQHPAAPAQERRQPPAERQAHPTTEAAHAPRQFEPPSAARRQPPVERQTHPTTEAAHAPRQFEPPSAARRQPPVERQARPTTSAAHTRPTEPPSAARRQPPVEKQTRPTTSAAHTRPTEPPSAERRQPPVEKQTHRTTSAAHTRPTEPPSAERRQPPVERQTHRTTTTAHAQHRAAPAQPRPAVRRPAPPAQAHMVRPPRPEEHRAPPPRPAEPERKPEHH